MEARQAPPLLEAVDVAKAFGGVQALKGVALTLRPGEIHGLVGANGAGKSTLIRILAGLTQADRGQILVDGAPVRIASPSHATEFGMSFIHQELAFVPGMNVIQNIMLGLPKMFAPRPDRLARHRARRRADREAGRHRRAAVRQRKGPLDRRELADRHLSRLGAQGASHRDGRADRLALDERERKASSIVRDLSQSGVAVLYVSHRLSEILEISDGVTVFRDGQSVRRLRKDELSREALVDAIVGRHVETARSGRRHVEAHAEAVLKVEGLTRLPRSRT